MDKPKETRAERPRETTEHREAPRSQTTGPSGPSGPSGPASPPHDTPKDSHEMSEEELKQYQPLAAYLTEQSKAE